MEFTGERFIPVKELMDDEIAFEHLHRYYNCLGIVKEKVVLDLACGEGYGAAILSKSASSVFGIDIDPKSIEHAKKTYNHSNIEFLQGSATQIPLPNASVDAVISFETIEHIDEKAQSEFLSEIKRVLKHDGKLIISTPDKENYTDRYAHVNEFHIKEFTRKEFIDFLASRFQYVSIYSQGYEIVDAITEESPEDVKKIEVIDWPRSSKSFSRKYLLAICADIELNDLNFSSIVMQVNKNYLDTMDTIVKKEVHIDNLSKWGQKLDKEVAEKNSYIKILQEEKSKLIDSELFFKGIINKQTVAIENFSTIEKENEKLRAKVETETRQSDLLNKQLKEMRDRASRLEQTHSSTQSTLAEKNLIVSSQSETINFLKNKVEEMSQKIMTLEGREKDNDIVVQKLKDKEIDLELQLGKVKGRLNEIYDSDGWKFLMKYYNIKGRVLREDSKRYEFLKKAINTIRGKKEVVKYEANSGNKNFVAEVPTTFDSLNFDVYQSPVVSIIIPVFNGWPVTYRCLKSIHDNTIGTSYEIIVADDGATDETRNIENYIKNIHVIRNEKNLGFLNNCNNAAKHAKGNYILFLNNDTEVRSGWLSALTDLMEKDEKIGMSGSKLIYPDGRLQEAGGIIWNDASAWNYGHNQDLSEPQFNYVKEVDYISGASIMIKASLWKEIGGFDIRYSPAYCEDSDLAFEIRKRGYKVVYQPLSEVVHYEGFSHGIDGQQGAIKEYQKINNLKLRDKWKDVLQREHFPNAENVFQARDRSSNKKTILVIDHYVPQYDKDAGSKTVFQYLQLFVSLGLNVKFIGDNFYRHEPYTTTLQQLGIEVLYGAWYANNWQQWLKDNRDQFDYILVNRPHITIKHIDFIKENTTAKILYYGHDLHFVREMRQYEIEKDEKLLASAKQWEETEKYIFSKSDVILTPSDEEKETVSKIVGEAKTESILPYFFETLAKPITDFSNRKNIFFVGGFSHRPNADGVLWFAKEIFPKVLAHNPEIKFLIGGSNTPKEVQDLQSDSIIIKGFLSESELDDMYNSVRMIIVPLRYGAGVKGKTVEAFYNGVPVVSTSIGLEGLPGDTSFISGYDTATEFANEIIRVYNSTDESLKDFSEKETGYINECFSMNTARSNMLKILENIS